MKKKRVMSGAVLVLVCIGFLFWFYPRKMSGIFTGAEKIMVNYSEAGMIEDGEPKVFCYSAVMMEGTKEYEAVCELLNRYSYHWSFRSMIPNVSIYGNGISVYFTTEQGAEVGIMDSGQIYVNGRAYRLGYFGKGDAEELLKGIRSLAD
ncbi:MAG: hypothetical protein ACI4EG_00645 [Fusicatenibacter sp.]